MAMWFFNRVGRALWNQLSRPGTCGSSTSQGQALADVERRYPAERYVMVDDKLRHPSRDEEGWGDHVTTVFRAKGKSRTTRRAPPPTRRRT